MSVRILTKNGIDNTNVDGARNNNFLAGYKSGIVKLALNECNVVAISSNVVSVDTGELLISGHRIVLDSAQSFNITTSADNLKFAIVAEVKVDESSEVLFNMFLQLASQPLIEDNLFNNQAGTGTYQIEIGTFVIQQDGTVTDVKRTADLIVGGAGALPQKKNITPTTTEQIIYADEGYILAKVTIEPVTAEIDPNIQGKNIKKGVSILGVEGELETENEGADPTLTLLLNGVKAKLNDSTVIYGKKIFSTTANSLFTQISLPNCVSLATDTFMGCDYAENIYLPKCLYLGQSCLAGAFSAKSIYIPNAYSLGSYCLLNAQQMTEFSQSYVRFINYQAFYGCKNLINVSIPRCYTIYSSAFAYCSSLENIYAPLANIYSSAFYGCSKLQTAIIRQGISTTFNNAINLTSVYLTSNSVPSSVIYFSSTPIVDSSYLGYFGSIYVPASLVDSYKVATGWNSLSERIAPFTDTNLDLYISSGLYSGSNIANIPNDEYNKQFLGAYAFAKTQISILSNPNFAFIGSSAFLSCSLLSEINLENTTSICSSAFFNCTNLKKINIPKVDYIESGIGYTFRYTYNVEYFNAPNIINFSNYDQLVSWKSIKYMNLENCLSKGYLTFYGSSKLEYLNIPNYPNLNGNFIYGCSNLPFIEFRNLSCISGQSNFENCINLSKVTINTPYVCELLDYYQFSNTPIVNSTYLGYYGSIYVPAQLVSQYKQTTNWIYYRDRITSIVD